MPETEAPPVRYCHGCEQYDDHPRAIVSVDADQPALDKLYHYDCLPSEFHSAEIQPAIDATAEGLRGAEVRELMTEHAASIEEAPADDPIDEEV